ncbi:hypothetical protein FHT78_000588 [Rhizobium sp. BK196]|uniref:hypothetical protein n=1 Tax=Rhizobium sp. BK196 TaxID=2587073 RepID=UPI001610F7C7|nr:hypothetical protein [Rhizobium sp. BK196]MBB3308859.1 hypothetical protein [Rhizobium sp. BK196]
MKATAIRPYRCLCIECEPLPPIKGLHPLTYADEAQTEARRTKGVLGAIAELVMPSRRKQDVE